MAELHEFLPSDWECKVDARSGKLYFINHQTQTTTWDDPRSFRVYLSTPKHLSNTEHIPLTHGSPDSRRNCIYPDQSSPLPAFKMSSAKTNPFQELKNTSRFSPLTVRSARVQDSSLSVLPNSDDAVSKISAMFPTVSETHIRLLMKKYHNREALVISALQVEKNPITTPGPFATPPPQRNIHHPGVYALQATPPLGLRPSSRGGSPVLRPGSGTNSTYTGSPRIGEGFRSSPRPHSSPKLKLRYMKSIFPQAEETIILEALYNNDSNIQKTSETLTEMGFQKKVKAQAILPKQEEDNKKSEEPKSKATVVKVRTEEEKALLKDELKKKYKDVAEHLITIALESVDFNEKRANQILEIIVQEDTEKSAPAPSVNNEVIKTDSELKPATLPPSLSRQSLKSLWKSEKIDKDKSVDTRINEECSVLTTSELKKSIARGPNKSNLLADYFKWQGPNPNLGKGSQKLDNGPNRSFLQNRTYQPRGSNSELCKGPKIGLAKGSIFSQLRKVVAEESRGK